MDLQTFLTGGSVLILLVAAVLTAPVSFFLLWLYRRAVLRGMKIAAGVTDAGPPPAAQALPGLPLRIAAVSRAFRPAEAGGRSAPGREATLSLRRLVLAYIAAGLPFLRSSSPRLGRPRLAETSRQSAFSC